MSSSFLKDLFITSFNADLAKLDCPARVAAGTGAHAGMIALRAADGDVLGYLPDDISPAVAAAAYTLYGCGLRHGTIASEGAPDDAVRAHRPRT